MKILILGGDGFCGWPTALRLANQGHNVFIFDNLSRREIDLDLNTNSLTDIAPIETRIEVAKDVLDASLYYENIDIVEEYNTMLYFLKQVKPDCIVHFAEQRAAPYSMISSSERRYTVDNNVSGTHNVCSVIVESGLDIHLVHLGTMGVYGYSAALGSIPEGYLNVKINETQEDVDILYPTNPGSIYHMTKSLDQILFQFYNKNWGLRVTDLHQGIVWGTQTKETSLHKDLVNRFDYDGIYGTVLNRFISQAATGNPMSVYGTGGQKRAFIHINDTVECINIAITSAPEKMEKVRIFNQVAEVRSLLELAQILQKTYGAEIGFVENPRKEAAENDLIVHNEGLCSLGFHPILLNNALIDDVRFIAEQCKDELHEENILNSPKWETK